MISSEPNDSPRPFVKWVGGKRQLLSELLPRVPERFTTYHEPFLGGGALFFALRPQRAILSDSNLRLVRTWRGIRDDVEAVVGRLQCFRHDKEFFLAMRKRAIDEESDIDVAAWFIYLNKTGYNGLYRVNTRNEFNVPFGQYKNPTICDADNLRRCSSALQGIELRHASFESVLDRAAPSDFVYFDPPYVPLSASSSFTSYTSDGFGPEEQTRLRDTARNLKAAGTQVLLSNSGAGFVRELYGEFQVEEVLASRAVNCKAEGRGKIKELVIR